MCTYPAMAGIGNFTNLPMFVDSLVWNCRLQSNSPCINWGNNDHVTWSNDLDENSRVVGNHVDIGAYEYQGVIGLADSDEDGLKDAWE